MNLNGWLVVFATVAVGCAMWAEFGVIGLLGFAAVCLMAAVTL